MSARGWSAVKICDLAQIERMAHILGGASAAQMALNEWQRRTDAGETVVILSTGSSLLVGPDPRSPPRSPLVKEKADGKAIDGRTHVCQR